MADQGWERVQALAGVERVIGVQREAAPAGMTGLLLVLVRKEPYWPQTRLAGRAQEGAHDRDRKRAREAADQRRTR